MLPNLSLVMEFLGNVFTNFIFKNIFRMKHWWREELQLPVSIKRTFLIAIHDKNCSSGIRSFDSFRSKLFAKVISCFESFSLNEYDLLTVSSVSRMEMFDLRGKELKYAKELLLNHCRNSVQNSVRLHDMCAELKL